jgi:hypothetical protein
MKSSLSLAGALAIALMWVSSASAVGPFARVANDQYNRWVASQRPWHGGYSYLPYNEPAALVVPPTVESHTEYSWGVAQTEIRPVWHQFGPQYPGGSYGGPFRATPYWPSHTDQFGVYYVRSPWRY